MTRTTVPTTKKGSKRAPTKPNKMILASRSKVRAKKIAQPESPPQPEMPRKEWGKKMVKGVNYKAACQRAVVVPTLYSDDSTLDALGIRDDVDWLFRKWGLRKFISLKSEAYEKLTKEFLGTVTVSFEDTKSPEAETGILYFRIGDTEYSITIPDLCKVFGFSNEDKIRFTHCKSTCSKWTRFAYDKYVGGSKAGQIKHPALRYAHRMLANIMFSRADTSAVKENEFYIMMAPFINDPQKVNLGAVLACELVEYKHYAYNNRDKDAVFGIGGVVSVILEACGIDLKEHTPVEGDNRIDLAFLGRTHYLGGWVDNPLQFAYRFTASYENEQIFLLPSPLLPSIKPDSTPFPPPESSFYVATSNRPLLLLSKYFAKERKSMRNVAKQPASESPAISQPLHQPVNAPLRTETDKWLYSSISRLEKNQARLEGKLACQSLIIAKLTRAVKKYAPPHIFRRSAKEKDPRQCHSDGDLSDTSVSLASSIEQHDLDTNAITSEPPAPVAPAMPDDDESSSSDDEF